MWGKISISLKLHIGEGLKKEMKKKEEKKGYFSWEKEREDRKKNRERKENREKRKKERKEKNQKFFWWIEKTWK